MLVNIFVVIVMIFSITLFGYSKWKRYTPTGKEEKEIELKNND